MTKMKPVAADWLAEIPFFSSLDPQHREAVALHARSRSCQRGEVVVYEGEPGESVFAIRRGTLKVSMSDGLGRVTTLGIMGPGEIFGELALLDGQPRSATVTAMTNAKLLTLDREAFYQLLESSPRAGIAVLGVLAQRIRRLSERSESSGGTRISRRLARQIVLLAESHGLPTPDGRLRIGVKLTQQDLAELVGATRESVNKHLMAWEEERLLVREAGHIVICDKQRMQRLAQGEPD